MFSRDSRYHGLPEVVVVDAAGRLVRSKHLRPLPGVDGALEHLLKSGDRLDHLAHTYYRQPTRWWRICDASPEILSPLALVGDEPVVTDRFPLTLPATGPAPWPALRAALHGTLGVEDVTFQDHVLLEAEEREVQGSRVTVQVERHHWTVAVTYNRLAVGPAALVATIRRTRFVAGPPQRVARAGDTLAIPPDLVT